METAIPLVSVQSYQAHWRSIVFQRRKKSLLTYTALAKRIKTKKSMISFLISETPRWLTPMRPRQAWMAFHGFLWTDEQSFPTEENILAILPCLTPYFLKLCNLYSQVRCITLAWKSSFYYSHFSIDLPIDRVKHRSDSITLISMMYTKLVALSWSLQGF